MGELHHRTSKTPQPNNIAKHLRRGHRLAFCASGWQPSCYVHWSNAAGTDELTQLTSPMIQPDHHRPALLREAVMSQPRTRNWRLLASGLTLAALLAFTALLLGGSPAAGADISGREDAGVHQGSVESLRARGILHGTDCAPGRFCPQAALPRWVMAVWLVRAIDGADPTPTASRFADVDHSAWWSSHVERLAEMKITNGCRTRPAEFCPRSAVSRAEAASFLVRAFKLTDDASAGFVDTSDSAHKLAIDALAAAGITKGCTTNPARFCANRAISRAEMASFLNRALQSDATIKWLSAGDSFASGVGTDPHGAGSCKRSQLAAGPAAADALRRQGWLIDDLTVACQGAVVADLFNRHSDSAAPLSQWEQYTRARGTTARADIVTLSIGGNDLGYGPVVLACLPFAAITELFSGGCPSESELRTRIDGFVQRLVDVYTSIAVQRLSERGRLYVIGYPSLVAPSSEWRLLHPCRAIFKASTANMLSRVASYLNSEIKDAVRRANSALSLERIHYVDTYSALRAGQHEVCGTGADYIHGVTHIGLDPRTGWHRSFHPNNDGHAKFASLAASEILRTFERRVAGPRS